MKKLSLLFAAALLWGAAARAQKIHTEFDEAADFSKYKTFAIRDGRIRTKQPALDNSLVEKKLKNALTAQLTAKGLQETSGQPDLNVTYLLGAVDRREVDVTRVGWRGRGARRDVHRYTEGTLVIDLRDAGKRELVWRAICTDTAGNAAKIQERIDRDVKKAFEKYPPKKK